MSSGHQSGHYGQDYDYLKGSPHLKHRQLYDELTSRIAGAVETARRPGRQPEVLEIGAGDGSVTEYLLARGYTVTATEMSADSVESMTRRFSGNDRFSAVLDPGDLSALGGARFDALLFASVLHHIPDYMPAVASSMASHLRPGGALATIQDPLWYPRMRPATKRLSDACFLSWRVTQGELFRGAGTRLRRRVIGLSEQAAGDAVEYHVVRDGVDEAALSALLEESFEQVDLFEYWSTQGAAQQRLGERLSKVNTFALFATGFQRSPQSLEGGSGKS